MKKTTDNSSSNGDALGRKKFANIVANQVFCALKKTYCMRKIDLYMKLKSTALEVFSPTSMCMHSFNVHCKKCFRVKILQQ